MRKKHILSYSYHILRQNYWSSGRVSVCIYSIKIGRVGLSCTCSVIFQRRIGSMMTSSNGNIFRYWSFVSGIHRSPVWYSAMTWFNPLNIKTFWIQTQAGVTLHNIVFISGRQQLIRKGFASPLSKLACNIWYSIESYYMEDRIHDDVIKWKHFPRNWPFVRGIHRSRWIPHTKASDAELWYFLWSAPE